MGKYMKILDKWCVFLDFLSSWAMVLAVLCCSGKILFSLAPFRAWAKRCRASCHFSTFLMAFPYATTVGSMRSQQIAA